MERRRNRRTDLRAAAVVGVLLLATSGWAAPAGEPPARLRLTVSAGKRYALVVQPGYTMFLLFPKPVEYIALGNQRVVRAWVRAREGTVALYAVGRSGSTNLHVRVGGQLLVFWVAVGRRRTADIVEVIPSRPAASRASPQKASTPRPTPRPRPRSSPTPPPPPPPTPVPEPTPPLQPPASPSPAPGVQASPQPEARVQEEGLPPGHGLGLPVRLRLRNTGTNWSEAWVSAAVSILLIGLPVLPATLIYEHEATVELAGMRASGRLPMRQRYVMMVKQGDPEGTLEVQLPGGRIGLRVWGEGERLRVELDPAIGSGAFEGVYGRGELYRTGQEGAFGVYEGVVAFGWESRAAAISKLRAALAGSDPGLAEAARRAVEQAPVVPLGRLPSRQAGGSGEGPGERVVWRPAGRVGTGEVELEVNRATRVRVVVAEGEGSRVLHEAETRGASSVRVPVSCSGPCVVLVYVDGRLVTQIRPWTGETGGR
ncbi:MAG: hypothetical protein QN208_09730 [Armatimonadota bacterium]|nr:hypothetical protein [Armatimonadota bacterium]